MNIKDQILYSKNDIQNLMDILDTFPKQDIELNYIKKLLITGKFN